MEQDDAALIALRLLQWLGSNPEHMARFCGRSGIEPVDLLTNGEDPVLHGGLLDFLLSDDTMLQDFCTTHNIDPDAPRLARARLPGAMPEY